MLLAILALSLQEDLGDYVLDKDIEDFVTWSVLEDALKNRIPETPPQPPPAPVPEKERAKSAKKLPSREAIEALQKVGALTGKHEALCDEVGGLEVRR